MHSDCQVQTAHFLKKCAILKDEDEPQLGKNPFKRGALTFEDFNYKMVNPHILKDTSGFEVETPGPAKKKPKLTRGVLELIDTKQAIVETSDEQTVTEENKSVETTKRSKESSRPKSLENSLQSERLKTVFMDEEVIQQIRESQEEDIFGKIVRLRDRSKEKDTAVKIMDYAP